MIENAYAMGQTGAMEGAAGQAAPSPMLSLLPFVFMFFIFYFILIRPQQRRQKEHANMLKAIAKGDQIVTAGGIHGEVVNVEDKTIIVKIDNNVTVKLDKSSVSYVKK